MNDTIPICSSALRSTPPGSPVSNPCPWPNLADLRGAALPCLLLMAAFPQAVKSGWLAQASGYGRDSILRGLNGLVGYGLVRYDPAQRSWFLTEIGRGFSLQLAVLFKMRLVLPENQGPVDKSLPLRPENQGPVDKSLPLRPENQGDGDKNVHHRPENQGDAGALSLKEVKKEESFKESKDSSSGLTSRPSSRPPPAPRQPDGEGQNDVAGLVARLLQHSASLFGEPLLGSPDDYPDLRRLLAVISEVYHNRHKLRKPARVAFVNYRQGHQPDLNYWDATNRYLPKEFHQQIGLPYRSPYLDWGTPVAAPRYESWTRSGDG